MKMGYAWQEALSALNEPGESQSPIYRVRHWQIGAALYLAGNLLQFLSYAFAAQSLLLALSSAQFGTHLLFAWLMEGVHVPFRNMLGAGVIIGFNLLLVIFGSKSSQLMTATELLELFRTPQYIAYQVVGAAACVAASVAYVGTASGTSCISKRFPLIARIRPVLLAVAASIPGTQALLHSKCLAMMFVVTLGQANQMGHWFFWVAAAVQLAAAALWTAALTHGMTVFPTVIVLPILQVIYTLVGIVCGTVFFQEWRDMSTLALCMYAVGFLGMAAGIRVSISAEALAEGLVQLDEGEQAGSDGDVSDGGSGFSYAVASSNSSGERARGRRTTFAARQSMHAVLAKTRSSMHATALTSLGLGDSKKLRCASVFVSPMALGAANLPDSSNRRMTMTQQAAMQRRRTILANTAAKQAQHSKSIPEASSEDEDRDGGPAPDWGRPVNNVDGTIGCEKNSHKGGHKHKNDPDGDKQGKKRGRREQGDEDRSEGESKGRTKGARSFMERWGLVGGPWGGSGDSSDEEGIKNRVKNVLRGGRSGGDKISSHEKKKTSRGYTDDKEKRRQKRGEEVTGKGKKTSKRKADVDRAVLGWDQHADREVENDTSTLQGIEDATPDRSHQLTTQQVTLGMGTQLHPKNATGPQHSPASSPSPPSPEMPLSRANLSDKSVSQLEMVMHGHFTDLSQSYTSPGSAPFQAMVPNLESHSTQHQGAPQMQGLQMNASHTHQQPYDHDLRSNPATASPAAAQHQYVNNNRQAPFEAAWSGQMAGPVAPGAAVYQTSSQHQPSSQHQQEGAVSIISVPREDMQVYEQLAYEPGALLRATSQLPFLSHELTYHGLNSQSQAFPAAQVLSHLGNQQHLPQQQTTAGSGSAGSSPWTSPSLSPAVTPATSRAPSAGHFHLGPEPPAAGLASRLDGMGYDGAVHTTSAARSNAAPLRISNTADVNNRGRSSFTFSFSGEAHGNTHKTHAAVPARREPFHVDNTNQLRTTTLDGARTSPPSASVSLAGWRPSSVHEPHTYRPPVLSAHHQVARQPSMAEERAFMGMHGQETGHHPTGQLDRVAEHGHGFGDTHSVHAYNPLALDSTPSSFTSVQGDMKGTRQPALTVDTFSGFYGGATSANENTISGAGTGATGMHAYLMSGAPTAAHTGNGQFNQLQMPGMQTSTDQWQQQQHALLHGGPSSVHVQQQQWQQPAFQQPQWPSRHFQTTLQTPAGFPPQHQEQFSGHQGASPFISQPQFSASDSQLHNPEPSVSTAYASRPQSRAGSSPHGQQVATSGVAASTLSQRGSAASSMTSFIAHDGVQDAPGLSWLYSQAPQQ